MNLNIRTLYFCAFYLWLIWFVCNYFWIQISNLCSFFLRPQNKFSFIKWYDVVVCVVVTGDLFCFQTITLVKVNGSLWNCIKRSNTLNGRLGLKFGLMVLTVLKLQALKGQKTSIFLLSGYQLMYKHFNCSEIVPQCLIPQVEG